MKTMVPDTTHVPHTWEDRLSAGQLREEELQILSEMVEQGDVETLEEAARLLDFKDREFNLRDSFYGH